MIVVTITIGLLASVLGYVAFDNHKKAIHAKVKFDNLKDFADKSGKRILELEKDKAGLANQVILLQSRQQIVKNDLNVKTEGHAHKSKPKKNFRPKPNKGSENKTNAVN
jgi:hypothetical protein